jgi:hypothetical protein
VWRATTHSPGTPAVRAQMPKLSLGYGAPAASPAEGAGGDAAGQSVVVDMVSSAFQVCGWLHVIQRAAHAAVSHGDHPPLVELRELPAPQVTAEAG